jgi:hypothetical protein
MIPLPAGPSTPPLLLTNLSVKSWALSVKRLNFYLSAVAVFAEVELSTLNV